MMKYKNNKIKKVSELKMIRLNKSDVEKMIINKDTFKIKLSLEVENIMCEEFRMIDDIIISYSNLRMNYKIPNVNDSDYKFFDNYLSYHDILDIIKNSYNIELIEYKKCDVDKKQNELYLQIQDMEHLMYEYERLLSSNGLTSILRDDINIRIQDIYIDSSELKTELNNYYIDNFDNTKCYDEYNDRYEELKKILD